ncbi:MAG: hybrid sensor histidine kinase/response regulator [Candidatus Sericytochromatia bacterium]|nr:hybrid sensor histidine kinase/response regulator [Candidatus Tanganyikabacteria bacterium]
MQFRIVVADDSPTIISILTSFLEGNGMVVIPATDGVEAITEVHRHRPDLVLLDIQMPRMDGYQVCRLLKDNPETAAIPIIALTSHAKASDIYWGHAAGADHYLSKDEDPEKLLDAIRHLLPEAPAAPPAEDAMVVPSDQQLFAMVNDLLDRKLFAASICNDLAALGEQISDVPNLLGCILEQGLNIWDYDAGAVVVRSRHLKLMYFLFPSGEHPEDRAQVMRSVLAALAEAGVHDSEAEYRVISGIGRQTPVAQALGRVRTWPLKNRGETVGVLAFGFRDPRRLARRAEEAFDVFARQVNTLVDNALLYHDSEAQAAELKDLYENLSRAKDDLVTSARMASIGQLASGLAHELNNPLNFIYGNLSHLERYLEDIEKLLALYAAAGDSEAISALKAELQFEYVLDDMHKALQSCRKGAERCRRLVRDLRSFAKGEELGAQPMDVNEGMETALALILRPYETRIAVVRDFGHLPPLIGIPGEIHQVFVNVLTNACQAIAENGEIHVSTRFADGKFEVVIRDSGVGIPEDHLPRIFDPFYTTRKVGEGKGLGLAISYGILSKHGGRIHAESAPGAGATFRLEIPESNPYAAAYTRSEPDRAVAEAEK